MINTATKEVNTTISVGTTPYSVAFTPDGQYAYVSNLLDGTISVIDANNNSVLTSTPTSSGSDLSYQWLLIVALTLIIFTSVVFLVAVATKKKRNIEPPVKNAYK